MTIDYDKVDLMGQLDSMRRGWQACEAERDALAAQNARLRAALERIKTPSDCGCRPCRGSCFSEAALFIEVEEIRQIAAEALALTPSAALEELRRRERSIGAEEELRRLATVADGNWAADELSDRADQIRDAREKGARSDAETA